VKKRLLGLVLGLSVMTLTVGCGGNNATASDASVNENESDISVVIENPDAIVENPDTKDYSSYILLGQYKGIEIPAVDLNITEEEIDEAINITMQFRATSTQITDRTVENGDTVNINYQGLLEGVAFDGGTQDGASLTIGSGQFIPGFEEGLIGVETGIEVELPITFPEQYHSEELAGKAVIFKVTVNFINGEQVVPELTDEYVKENFQADSISSYREQVKADLEETAKINGEDEQLRTLVQTVIDNAEVIFLPDHMLEEEIEKATNYYEQVAASAQMTLEQYAQMGGMTLEEFTIEIANQAEMVLKRLIVMKLIVEEENIIIKEADYENFLIEYGFDNRKELEDTFGAQVVYDALLSQKVSEFILENAVIK
jgi:trigger factor